MPTFCWRSEAGSRTVPFSSRRVSRCVWCFQGVTWSPSGSRRWTLMSEQWVSTFCHWPEASSRIPWGSHRVFCCVWCVQGVRRDLQVGAGAERTPVRWQSWGQQSHHPPRLQEQVSSGRCVLDLAWQRWAWLVHELTAGMYIYVGWV